MTLHPANVQDAHRTPVPDVSGGRVAFAWRATAARTCTRPSGMAGPIRSRSTVTSFAVPSSIARSFHIRPRCEARGLSNPEAFRQFPPTCHLFHARCHLARGKGMDSKGGPFSLHVDGGDSRRIHTTRMRRRTDAVT